MNEIVKMLKNGYEDSYKMLKSAVTICPDELWKADNNGLPVWNHVIHALIGSDFWLRLDYMEDCSLCYALPDNVRGKMPDKVLNKLLNDEWCTENDGFMTKEQVLDCFKAFDEKKDKFFDSLNDEMLCRKIRNDMEFTYFSVICAQIRHIMCHEGMCENAILAFGGEEVPWKAFGETEE